MVLGEPSAGGAAGAPSPLAGGATGAPASPFTPAAAGAFAFSGLKRITSCLPTTESDAAPGSDNEINKRVYETWGRAVEFTFVKTSGPDEAAQRADAVKVASMKPFAVLDEATAIGTPPVGGGAVFEQA